MPGSASAAVAGNQDFLVVFAGPPGTPGRVGASSAYAGVGTVTTPEGQPPRPFPAVFSFPQGQLFLTITPTGSALSFDPQTCVIAGPIFGTYQVTGGTGQFSGASGGGTFEGTTYILLQRDSQGRCFGPPAAVYQVIRNPGTISLPNFQAA
ncbi:MAG: hypothetical protein M3144_09890 [Actinomycetota bacterium]|nr:hypothetical protein [Actinomycetota bacterium]